MLTEWSSKWIKIVDKFNDIVIDDFDYKHGIRGAVTTKHCIKCIAANQCWFVDEKNKKPEPMEYSIEEILNDTKHKIGLYHYNCHCKEINIPSPKESDIELIITEGKIDFFFKDKSDWVRSWGHEPNEEFLEYLKNLVVKNYCAGDYFIYGHNEHGVAINVIVEIEGKGEHFGKKYRVKTGWMVFTNGKLKNNTLIAGRRNEII